MTITHNESTRVSDKLYPVIVDEVHKLRDVAFVRSGMDPMSDWQNITVNLPEISSNKNWIKLRRLDLELFELAQLNNGILTNGIRFREDSYLELAYSGLFAEHQWHGSWSNPNPDNITDYNLGDKAAQKIATRLDLARLAVTGLIARVHIQ